MKLQAAILNFFGALRGAWRFFPARITTYGQLQEK
jgi:hypothetical protein